jgi:NagD protein
LSYMGLDVPAEAIFTSALATAQFLHAQRPGGRAYAIGESGLTTALHDIGYVLTDQEPEYVVLGETTAYSFDRITRAVRFVMAGARFIATNPDAMGPAEGGIVPATGAVATLISADTVMIGDRMDTDIIAGIESGLQTILVLTGVTTQEQVERFSYRPTWVRESIAEVEV